MKFANPQFGLVLTGSGAIGAYQAGALKYLAELGVEPHIIAGTSIGAFNGAVLASHQPFDQSVYRLNEFWTQLGQAPILPINTDTELHTPSDVARTFVPTLQEWMLNFLVQEGSLKDSTAIFDRTPIGQMLRQAFHPAELRRGIELWITLFPALKIPDLDYDWLLDFACTSTSTDTHWLCVQDFADDASTLYKLLLASVALPVAFPNRQFNGQLYLDGGLVDNVPLKALAAQGCTHIIVIHLGNSSAWNYHDFPAPTVIEIRPKQQINKSDTLVIGFIDSWLDFSAERIAELKNRGYEDANLCIEPMLQIFKSKRRPVRLNAQ